MARSLDVRNVNRAATMVGSRTLSVFVLSVFRSLGADSPNYLSEQSRTACANVVERHVSCLISVMTEPNLYQMVFGLPESVREPDYYELLGVPRFSHNVKAIRNAAVLRQSELLKWQNFDDQVAIDRLQSEIVNAIQTLEQTASRNAYDEELKHSLHRTNVQDATEQDSLPGSFSDPTKPEPVVLPKASRETESRPPALPSANTDRTTSQASANKSPRRKKSNAPDWFSRARELKQEPTDDAIITSPIVLSAEDVLKPPAQENGNRKQPPTRADKPHSKLAATPRSLPALQKSTEQEPRPNPSREDVVSGEAAMTPFRLRDIPDAIEAQAGRLFLLVASVSRVYEPLERTIFRHLLSFKSLLLAIVLFPFRLPAYLLSPLFRQGVKRADLEYVASSAWIRLRDHEQHPWVSGLPAQRHITVPDRCVECNKTTEAKPRTRIFRLYDRQSVLYLFLMSLIVAYCGEPYLGRWAFGASLTGTQYFASLATAYLISIVAMRPFVRAKCFAVSTARCVKHANSPYPIVTIQGGHHVLHVGSRDLQREFDNEWVFDNSKP
jgi:hypothetical protein